jgi:hypothetical protein
MGTVDGSDEISEEVIDQTFADPEMAATQVPRLAAIPAVDSLIALLDADNALIQEMAMYALMALADKKPEAVVPAVDALVARMDDSDLGEPATTTLSRIGRDRLAELGMLDATTEVTH